MLPGFGPLFLCTRGTSSGLSGAVPFCAAAAAASATALSRASVSLLGRRPLTPFLTGRAGRGVGSR